MSEQLISNRRRFMRHGAMTLAAAEFVGIGSAAPIDGRIVRHNIRATEAGRRRPPERWLRGSWPCERHSGDPSSRLAVRHSQFRGCRPLVGRRGLPPVWTPSAGPTVPGLVDPGATSFGSVSDLASAMRRAAAAHGEHEKRIAQADANWPDWAAAYMVAEASGAKLPK